MNDMLGWKKVFSFFLRDSKKHFEKMQQGQENRQTYLPPKKLLALNEKRQMCLTVVRGLGVRYSQKNIPLSKDNFLFIIENFKAV